LVRGAEQRAEPGAEFDVRFRGQVLLVADHHQAAVFAPDLFQFADHVVAEAVVQVDAPDFSAKVRRQGFNVKVHRSFPPDPHYVISCPNFNAPPLERSR
jgi:hypothetical protein